MFYTHTKDNQIFRIEGPKSLLTMLQANVYKNMQEEINRRISIHSLCGCHLQLHAMGILCVTQGQYYPSHHHQHRWNRY